MTDPRAYLEAVLAKAEAATGGPWRGEFYEGAALPKARLVAVVEPPNENGYDRVVALGEYLIPENAAFIASSRTSVPVMARALLAVLDDCDRAIERSKARSEQLGFYPLPLFNADDIFRTVTTELAKEDRA